MTTLAITPNWKNKSAKFKGTVAAGEHVSVTILNDDGEGGEFIADASTLRLRVVNPCNGRTLAIFPEPVPEGETPETWDSDLSPLRCTLNLNTVQMLKAVPPAANVPLLFVLDDYDNNTLYFKEQFPVEHWPRLRGEEEPTDLDNYKDIIADFNTRLDGYDTRITGAENAAQAATENASAAAAKANQAVGIANQALDKAETAQNSAAASAEAAAVAQVAAKAAQAAAEKAAESINSPDATLSEEGVAADAKAAGDAIAAEKERAETAEAAEETRAKGVESGLRTDLTAAQKAIDDEAVLRAAADADLEANKADKIAVAAISSDVAAAQTAISNLSANKADKSDTYTKTEVDTKIAGVQTFQKYLVQTLPDPDEADMKGLYLVPTGETSEEGDLCEEWTVVEENGEKRWELIGAKAVDLTLDDAVTRTSPNGVKSSGIWSALWGTASTAFTSLYDWCVAQLGLKRDLTNMACTVAVAGIPQIGRGNFVVTSPSGTSTTLTPFDSYGVIGWGWYMTYPYIYARASSSYDIIFGTGIQDIIPLDMTAKTQTVTYNGETWIVDAYTGAIVISRLANMTDIPAASTSTPQMDGAGAAGTSAAYARGDHVHPTDTSRVPTSRTVNNKALSSDVTLDAEDVGALPSTTDGSNEYVSADVHFTGGNGDITLPLGGTGTLTYLPRGESTTQNNLAAWKTSGGLTDSGKKPSDFQSALSAQQLANIAAVSNALAFDVAHSYAAGDPVVYNGTLYTFTTAHTGAWTGSDVSAVDIIARLAGKLDQVDPNGGYAAIRWNQVTGSLEFTTPNGESVHFPVSAFDGTYFALTADLLAKLDSTSAAPAFSSDSTVQYAVGSHVTYNGKLYKCTTATTGGTWVAGSWTAEDMTTPDATLDVTATDKLLRLVATNGDVIWGQGYNLSTTSSATVLTEQVSAFTFAADAASDQAIVLPSIAAGKVGDFILDVTNLSANDRSLTLTGLDSAFSVVVKAGDDLSETLTVAAGEMARYYFTMTAFRVNSLPTWQVAKEAVENGGAQS